MASYPTRDFEAALERKGFKRDETHHAMFWYHYRGRKTTVRTRTSHGETDFDDGLLAQRRRQMGDLSKRQILDFIECPMSAETFEKHLVESGRIVPRAPDEPPG